MSKHTSPPEPLAVSAPPEAPAPPAPEATGIQKAETLWREAGAAAGGLQREVQSLERNEREAKGRLETVRERMGHVRDMQEAKSLQDELEKATRALGLIQTVLASKRAAIQAARARERAAEEALRQLEQRAEWLRKEAIPSQARAVAHAAELVGGAKMRVKVTEDEHRAAEAQAEAYRAELRDLTGE